MSNVVNTCSHTFKIIYNILNFLLCRWCQVQGGIGGSSEVLLAVALLASCPFYLFSFIYSFIYLLLLDECEMTFIFLLISPTSDLLICLPVFADLFFHLFICSLWWWFVRVRGGEECICVSQRRQSLVTSSPWPGLERCLAMISM